VYKPINEFITYHLQGCVDKLIEIVYENWVTLFAITAAVILLELVSLTFALLPSLSYSPIRLPRHRHTVHIGRVLWLLWSLSGVAMYAGFGE